jgi:DNA-binding transcriptional ArsR family regulator
VSQHLRILRGAGLVIPDKRGYYVHYQISEKTLATWKELADRLLRAKTE